MPAPPRLVVLAGPLVGTIVPLDREETALGRHSSSDVVLDDPTVSRRHCVIRRELDGHVAEDLGSRQGTRVNGIRITKRRLATGDRISIGECELAFLGDPLAERGRDARVELVDSAPFLGSTRELSLDDTLLSRPGRLLGPGAGGTAARDLDALMAIGSAVREAESLRDLAHAVLRLLRDLIPAQRAGVLLTADDTTDLMPRIEFMTAIADDGLALRVSRTVATAVLHRRTALLTNAAMSDPDTDPASSLRDDAVRAVLCVPVPLFDRTIGVLYMDSSRPGAQFTQEDLELVAAVAGLVAMPMALLARSAPPAEAVVVADADAVAARTSGGGRVVVLLQPDAPLDLFGALRLRGMLDRVADRAFEPIALLLDYGMAAGAPTASGLSSDCLERLAVLRPSEMESVTLASAAPSLASLAALVATTHEPAPRAGADSRAWFREVLGAAALVAGRAARVVMEAEPASGAFGGGPAPGDDGLAVVDRARDLARRAGRVLPSSLPIPLPVASGLPALLPLDGSDPAAPSAKGTIFLRDPPDVVARKIRSAKTDLRPVLDPDAELSPEVASLVLLLSMLSGETVTSVLARLAGKGYGALKGELADAAAAWLEPVRQRYAALERDLLLPGRILSAGGAIERSAREIAGALSRRPESMARATPVAGAPRRGGDR